METSGHELQVEGSRVDAGAPQGQGGLWYLDPTDATITQAVADSYQTTLNTGTSVLNDVVGTITWNSGVTLSKTAGGNASLTLNAANTYAGGTTVSGGSLIQGRANALALPRRAVTLRQGDTSRQKIIHVAGLTLAEVRAKLGG